MALVLSARRRLRAADLSEQFGVSERSVYRDIAALQEAGFPVVGSAGDGYQVPAAAFLKPLQLTQSEAVALAMAAQTLEATADPRLRDLLQLALGKVESVLSPEARRQVRRQRAEVLVPAGALRPGGPLGAVLEAMASRSVLRIHYQAVKDDRASEREIEPLGLVRLVDGWLLVAYCRLRHAARAFRVDRIRSVHPTGEAYAPRPGSTFAEVIAGEEGRRGGRTGS